jgi:hypothetical protein
MKRTNTWLIILFTGITILASIVSCNKTPDAVEKLKQSCLYDSKTDYFKKWANTFTEIDVTNSAGVVQSKSYIYPLGYFQLNSSSTYNVLSDNYPLSGNWTITDSCQLELDAGTALDRKFDVLLLTADSLTLKRTATGFTYIQHYAAYQCPDVTQLEKQWDNAYILEQNYNSTIVYNPIYGTPTGYFILNSDYSYDVLSDGVPLNGQWTLDPNGCKLVLDKGTNLERGFDIQKITADSLVIWRKDTVAQMNYQQHYIKH